jgi:hypothetical protein
MSGRRRRVAGLALLTFGWLTSLLTSAALCQPAAPQVAITFVDGRPAGRVTLHAGANGELVGLAALARNLGWRFLMRGTNVELNGDGRRLELAIGTSRVLEDGRESALLSVALTRIGGTVYLALADVPDLFYVRTKLEGNRLEVSTTTIAANEVEEVKVSPTATPAAAPPSRWSLAPAVPSRQTASVSMSLNALGSQRYYQFGIISNGAGLRSNVMLTGADQLSPPSGSVTFGPEARNVTIGTNTDPLSGIILRNGGLTGIDAYDRASGNEVVAGRRYAGQDLIGVSHRKERVSESVALLVANGRFDQVLARRTVESPQSWGEIDNEVLFGTKGGGAGIYARTKGRTFLEATATTVTHGLPLTRNDAPLQLDAARQVSQSVTVRTGFVSGYELKLTPFASVSARANNATFSATLGGSGSQIGASYLTDRFNGQFGAGTGIGGRWTYLFAAVPLRQLTLDLQSLDNAPNRDTTLELQTQGRAVNYIGGLEDVGTNIMHFGPIVGLSVPIFSGLAAQVAYNPTTAGDNIRLGLNATFKAANGQAVPIDRVTISVAGASGPGLMSLLVDGTRVQHFSGSSVAADIPRGSHLISVETDDGTQGSPEARYDVHHGSSFALSLAPMRIIQGRVRVEAAASQIPKYFELSGVTVLLQPWGQVATVDEDGNFTFSKQVIVPGSTLIIDPSSLPPDLALEQPIPVPDSGRAELIIGPTKKLEKFAFPSH